MCLRMKIRRIIDKYSQRCRRWWEIGAMPSWLRLLIAFKAILLTSCTIILRFFPTWKILPRLKQEVKWENVKGRVFIASNEHHIWMQMIVFEVECSNLPISLINGNRCRIATRLCCPLFWQATTSVQLLMTLPNLKGMTILNGWQLLLLSVRK